MPARGYEFHFILYSVYYINNNNKDILTIFRRFPKIFKILRTLSEVHTNISHHFPKISEDVRRLSKVVEYFRGNLEDVSII